MLPPGNYKSLVKCSSNPQPIGWRLQKLVDERANFVKSWKGNCSMLNELLSSVEQMEFCWLSYSYSWASAETHANASAPYKYYIRSYHHKVLQEELNKHINVRTSLQTTVEVKERTRPMDVAVHVAKALGWVSPSTLGHAQACLHKELSGSCCARRSLIECNWGRELGFYYVHFVSEYFY